ncbi:MAG: adenine nucleotide alpha hydrolase [Acidobacteria bacterium]|nr:MAG: adenine nucleotide alpha hydrolase [Acidobacteriota bacterium]
MGRPTAAISWSGGKDSCAAYHRARDAFDIVAAITMFNEDGTRSRSHGLRPELVEAQVQRLGLRSITQRCAWETYDAAFDRALAEAAALGVTHVIFGDILFDEHRDWAERLSGGRGLEAVEPLWKQSTTDLYRDFLASGTSARIVTVRSSKLDESYLGRDLAEDLLDEFLARDVDPCGERGEYHTVVTSCPAFSRPLRVRALGRASHSGCVAEDLVLDE